MPAFGLMLGLAAARHRLIPGDGPPPEPSIPVTAVVMGQSELDYLFNTGSNYRQITQPTPGDGNLIVFRQTGTGNAPVRTVVNASSVAAGEVNPAMTALSAFLDYAAPGTTFVVGDGAVQGTGRGDLADDTTNASDTRLWTDFSSVAGAIETEFGKVGHLIECWYNNDAGLIADFKGNFWPFYFGAKGDGTAFTLGTVNNTRQVDHCLWDASAAPSAKGRGLFSRAETAWHILTPMPFLDSVLSPNEQTNFSDITLRLKEPARQLMHALADNTLAQSVGVQVGPSAHLCRYGGASTEIHPDTGSADGQVLQVWPVAVALLRAAGNSIAEPTIHSATVQSDGSYAELLVDLPNGGNLTTLAALRGTTYSGSSPHQQAVTGIEIMRATGVRSPVFKTTETGRAASTRGTVTIVDAGSGNPRRGRVRITPSQPFAFGDSLSYLRGQATAVLQEPRDFDLYPWFLMEHIPALYDATALYPFEGIAVRPLQEDVALPLPAPAFAARSAKFADGAMLRNASAGVPVPADGNGILSLWFKSNDTAWNALSGRRPLQFRVGSTAVLELFVTSSGRFTFRLNNDTATDTRVFYAGPTSATPFEVAKFYHILAGWTATGLAIYVNSVAGGTLAYTALDMAGATITQIGIGGESSNANHMPCDIGHLYLNLSETLDFSVAANREKFIKDGAPVNLGADGSLPTGTAPQFYFDGDVPAWNNKGTAGSVPLVGELTVGAEPHL